MVAWYEHGAAYWVGNTLNDTVPNGELLAIAEQTHPFATSGARPARAARAREQRAQLNASSRVMAQLGDAVARIAPARRVAEPTGASDRKGEG